jgi:predicted GIY-YIG superfamily endonuclease
MVCFRCGRTGHYANNCYAKTDVYKAPLDSDFSDSESDEEYFARQKKRTKCAPAARVLTPRIQSTRRGGVYVLRTTAGMYYVGKSNDIEARIEDHRRGSGAACLNGSHFHVVTNLLTSGSVDDLESWERNETLQSMRAYGIDNVRGWMFTSTSLSDDHYHTAFCQICEKFDLCRRCGRNTHFADKCFAGRFDGWAGGGSI